MSAALRIEGYAIVSEDGMLADATGVMPESLKFDADQKFFEHGLDNVDVVVHGRHSHEQQRRSPLRRRVILTRKIPDIAPDPANEKALWWNPAGSSFEQALAAIGVPNGTVGVIGGGDVFGLFLPRYDVFFLSRAPDVRLPGGRPVFPGVPSRTPEYMLACHGLVAGERQVLDAAKDLAVIGWQRIPGRAEDVATTLSRTSATFSCERCRPKVWPLVRSSAHSPVALDPFNKRPS